MFVLHLVQQPLYSRPSTCWYITLTKASADMSFPPLPTYDEISWQVDIFDVKFLFLPFKWIGMNAMLVFVMAAEGIFAGFINGWYYGDPHNTLVCLYHQFSPSIWWHVDNLSVMISKSYFPLSTEKTNASIL